MSKVNKLKSLLSDLDLDYVKFSNGNKSAGTRVRKTAMEMKNVLQELRVEISEKKKNG